MKAPVLTTAKAAALVAAILTACSALTGCGTSQASPDGAAAGSTIPETIRIAAANTPSSLDTDGWYDFAAQISYLYGGTLTSPGWGEDSGRPELAESVVESPDRLSWTVKLREGLKFSDGTPLTASDVKASLEYLDIMRWTVMFLLDTEEIEVVDDLTVVIHLSRPHTDLPSQLAEPYPLMFPADQLAQGEAFWERPISAGRYQIDSMDLANGRFELSANPNYYKGVQQVKKIVITAVPEAATRLSQLKNGEVDYIYNVPASLSSQVTGDLRLDVGYWPGSYHGYLANFNDPVIGDLNVRQAINLTIDRQAIADDVLGGADFARPLAGIPWNIEGGEPNTPVPAPDLERAKELLKGTVCENGCATKLVTGADNFWQRSLSALAVQDQLKQIGIEIEIVAPSPAQLSEIMEAGDFGLTSAIASWFDDSRNYLGQVMIDPGTLYNDTYSKGFSQTATAAKMRDLAERFRSAQGLELDELVTEANELFATEQISFPVAILSATGATSLPESVMTNIYSLYYVIP
jgi:ABC-type transport system substrate-binding protein